jgi:hypothetical protein
MHIIMTAALQWQYSQTELIFWITLIFFLIHHMKAGPSCHTLRRRCMATRVLLSWVQIPQEVWMFVVCVCVVR